jgi:hypothetical protein
MADKESVDALKKLPGIVLRAFGVAVCFAFGGFFAIQLSRFFFGLPDFNPHGSVEIPLAAFSVLGGFAWVPIAGAVFMDRRHAGRESPQIDKWLLSVNATCLGVFGLLWALNAS